MKKVGIISLGCAKNLVDSEIILASFIKAGYIVTTNPQEANVIIINTCGFIKSSQVESLNTILEMKKYPAKIIVTGCLAELFSKELKRDYPNLDLIIPFSKYPNFSKLVSSYFKDHKKYEFNPLNRKLLTTKNFAYLRIAEGCNNFCSFCAIPYIRGRYRSRPIKEIVKEAKILASQGVTEISVIAQDTSYYGKDFKDGTSIEKLLNELEKINGIKHIRLLYLYPSEITDNFIEFMKYSKKVYPYFDIPLQHVNDKILKSMNRKGNFESTLKILNKIRKEIPNAIFRTTFIVGFPNETNSSFNELIEFIKDFKFDLVGCFTYSREVNTKAYNLKPQISEKIKTARRNLLMKTQYEISLSKNKHKIGEVIEGLYIGKDPNTNYHHFLTKYNSPDDSDGGVFSKNNKSLKLGKHYKLKVKAALAYDLIVEILK